MMGSTSSGRGQSSHRIVTLTRGPGKRAGQGTWIWGRAGRRQGKTNVTGLRLYERHGFQTVGIYHEQGMLDGRWIDVIVMEKLFS
jgi:hypothetical protein